MTAARMDHPLARDVITGADDFLFHSFDNAFEQLCGEMFPANRHIESWASLIESDFAWCALKKINYVTLVIPERHVIYADKLPPGCLVSPGRPMMRLLERLDPAARSSILYPAAALLAARVDGEVFLKTDEHLNSHGNYICYRALLNHIRPMAESTALPRQSLAGKLVRASGNLGMRLDHEPMEDVETWHPPSESGVRRIFRNRGGAGRVEVFQHHDRTLPKCIIFGDSNVNQLQHALLEHFSRTVVVSHSHHLYHDLVHSEQPDVVIHVMSELYLGAPYMDGGFLLHCGERLPDHPTQLAIDFSTLGKPQSYLGQGWSYPEDARTWMTGTISILKLPRNITEILAYENDALTLTIDLWPLISKSVGRDRQRLIISHGNKMSWAELGKFEISKGANLRIPLPRFERWDGQDTFLRFHHPDGFAPSAEDQRVLSLAVMQLCISPTQ